MVGSWLSVVVDVEKVEGVEGLGLRMSLRLDRLV